MEIKLRVYFWGPFNKSYVTAWPRFSGLLTSEFPGHADATRRDENNRPLLEVVFQFLARLIIFQIDINGIIINFYQR